MSNNKSVDLTSKNDGRGFRRRPRSVASLFAQFSRFKVVAVSFAATEEELLAGAALGLVEPHSQLVVARTPARREATHVGDRHVRRRTKPWKEIFGSGAEGEALEEMSVGGRELGGKTAGVVSNESSE